MAMPFSDITDNACRASRRFLDSASQSLNTSLKERGVRLTICRCWECVNQNERLDVEVMVAEENAPSLMRQARSPKMPQFFFKPRVEENVECSQWNNALFCDSQLVERDGTRIG